MSRPLHYYLEYCPAAYDRKQVSLLIAKAAKSWNQGLAGKVRLIETLDPKADITLRWGNIPEQLLKPDLVGFCRRGRPGTHIITFASNKKWAITRWQRLLGLGEDLVKFATHEFGHALGLAHSPEPGDVMYFAPVSGEISHQEAEQYRAQLPT